MGALNDHVILSSPSEIRKTAPTFREDPEKLSAEANDLQAHVVRTYETVQPLILQAGEMDREVHRIFAALLAKGRLKRNDRKAVRTLYLMLQNMGVLAPAEDLDAELSGFGDAPDQEAPDVGENAHSHGPPPRTPDEVASESRPASGTSSLRELFRRLAVAMHPDKSQDETAREQRTEAMKEVSRAYQDGDLARLLELEQAWLAMGDIHAANDDDTDRRCANLERTNQELKKQLKELDARLRDLRRAGTAGLAIALGMNRRNAESRIAELEAEAKDVLDRTRRIRDFAQSFADGKMTLDEFLMGPKIAEAEDVAEEDDSPFDLDHLGDFMSMLFRDEIVSAIGQPRRRRRRR